MVPVIDHVPIIVQVIHVEMEENVFHYVQHFIVVANYLIMELLVVSVSSH